MASSKLDTQHIVEEIRSLAEERRRLLLEALLEPPARTHVPGDACGKHVDLRAPVPIPYAGPRRWAIWILDRLRRRFLHSILIRQTQFNDDTLASLEDLAARYGATARAQRRAEDAMEALVGRVAQIEAHLSRAAVGQNTYHGAVPEESSDRSGDPSAAEIGERQQTYIDCFRRPGIPNGAAILDLMSFSHA